MLSADVQPTLSFSQRKPSLPTLSKTKPHASLSDVDLTPTREDAPVLTPPAVEEVHIRDGAKVVERKKELGLGNGKRTASSANAGDGRAALDQAAKKKARKELDVKSKEWAGLYKEAQIAMGGGQPSKSMAMFMSFILHLLGLWNSDRHVKISGCPVS